MAIRSIRSTVLRRLWEDDDVRGLPPKDLRRLRAILLASTRPPSAVISSGSAASIGCAAIWPATGPCAWIVSAGSCFDTRMAMRTTSSI